MKICDIYSTDSGSCLVIDDNKSGLFDDENPILVFSFAALSYNDAMQRYYDYFGWGEYCPFDPTGNEPW